MDIILTNSLNTQARIKKFVGKDSIVLYPPVDTKKFTYIDTKDYYLSFARLADAKRVDKVVEAFKKMPDKKLIVIYGENDPAREKIFNQAN
jgi:glycosyltransferase involved in cell wall biosynthesis